MKKSVRKAVPRYRKRNSGALMAYPLSYRGGSLNPYYQAWSGTVPVGALAGSFQEISDYVTPGFRELIRQGVQINNPCTRSSRTHVPYLAADYYHSSPNGWEYVNGPTVSWIVGRIEQSLPSSTIPYDSLSRLATLEAWARVEPAKSQTLVTALEAHKTWGTIHDRAMKIAKIVEAVRRKDVRALRNLMPGTKRAKIPSKVVLWDDDGRPLLDRRGRPKKFHAKSLQYTSTGYLDEASQLWLEYRYGWCPLVYDIVDSLKAVYAADLRKDLLPRDIHISRGKGKDSCTSQTTATKIAGGLTYYTKSVAVYEFEVRTFIRYRWSAPDGVLRRLNDFGLFDVPRAIWEIVPFSFIADWFCPIGDWLGALTPKIGVENISMGHSVTQKVTAFQEITGVPAINPPGAPPEARWSPACPVGSKDSYIAVDYDRKTYLGVPYYPPIDVKLNIKRLADAAALFKRLR